MPPIIAPRDPSVGFAEAAHIVRNGLTGERGGGPQARRPVPHAHASGRCAIRRAPRSAVYGATVNEMSCVQFKSAGCCTIGLRSGRSIPFSQSIHVGKARGANCVTDPL